VELLGAGPGRVGSNGPEIAPDLTSDLQTLPGTWGP
jgi:hypothetical protein